MAAEHASPDGGTGVHVVASVNALRQGGNEVLLVVGEHTASSDSLANAHVIPGLIDKNAPADAVRDFAALVDQLKPDLVHIQQLPDTRFISRVCKQTPVVYNVHGHLGCTSGLKYFRLPGQECKRAHGPGCVPNLLFRGCAHTRNPRDLPTNYQRTGRILDGLKLAHAVVAHSEFVLNGLRQNGVEWAFAVPLFVEQPSEPSPPPLDGPIVFAGRVTPTKGVGTFLRAAALVDAPIEILGDGWWIPKARRLGRRLGIENRLTFRGWLAPEELTRAFQGARIVVVPSHWPEPFGLVGLEAMAVGRPVVGSATGGIPEWLDHGSNGLLVAPGDVSELGEALARLLSDSDLAARMGALGAMRARTEFTAERYLDALEAAYDAAANRWSSA